MEKYAVNGDILWKFKTWGAIEWNCNGGCFNHANCTAWTLNKAEKMCYVFEKVESVVEGKNEVSGWKCDEGDF